MKPHVNELAVAKRKRVFLVDQFPISQTAAAEWLSQTGDLMVCGEAESEAVAVTAIEHLKPDAVVTEVLHQQDLGFIRGLHHDHPELPILVYSFRDEEWYAPLALKAGAEGYLMKGAGSSELVAGIRAALERRVVLSPKMKVRLLAKCGRKLHRIRRKKKENRFGVRHDRRN